MAIYIYIYIYIYTVFAQFWGELMLTAQYIHKIVVFFTLLNSVCDEIINYDATSICLFAIVTRWHTTGNLTASFSIVAILCSHIFIQLINNQVFLQ